MSDALTFIDHWVRPATDEALRLDIIARALPQIPTDLAANELYGQSVFGADRASGRINVLSANSVAPHVDTDFSEWSALWVLDHGVGHHFHIADHVTKGEGGTGRVHKSRPQWAIPVVMNQVILFNAHRAHWLPKTPDKRLFVAASFDFQERPTREAVEARIAEELHLYSQVSKAA